MQDTYGEHAVKLPAGDLVLYTSGSLHRVNPVTRGCRTSSFFWTQSMVPDERHREHLFRLDQTIQKIAREIRRERGDGRAGRALSQPVEDVVGDLRGSRAG